MFDPLTGINLVFVATWSCLSPMAMKAMTT